MKKILFLATLSSQRLRLKFIIPLIVFCAFFSLTKTSQAATYYVDATNGNDSWTGTAGARVGTTMTGPWKTIGKVNDFTFRPGDDVYFKCGGTWSGTQLSIDWSGVSAANPSVIGAYYGSGTVVTAANLGSAGTLPIIDGIPTGTGESKAGTVPTHNSYSGLVDCRDRSFVTVEFLTIQWSGDIGVNFERATNNILRNCTIVSSWTSGVKFNHGSDNNLIQDNTVTDTGRIRYATGGYAQSIGIIGGSSGNIASNNIVRGNHVYLNHGEGIDIIKWAYNNIVEYNTVISNRAVNIYVAGHSIGNVVRYNLVYHYNDAPWPSERGIAVDDEGWFPDPGTQGNKIYGNLLANLPNGIGLHASSENGVGAKIKDTLVYNNTLIDCGCAFRFWNGVTSDEFENSEVKNNIVWITGEKTGCIFSDVIDNHPGLTFDYNLWSSDPAPKLQGAHDPPAGAPSLIKTNGWGSLVYQEIVPADFILKSIDTKAKDLGADLGSAYAMDFGGTARPQGVGWDIGAHEYTTGSIDTTVPGIPSGLSVR